MTFDEIREIALSFPRVEEHLIFHNPTFKVGKRFLACIAKIDDNTLVMKVPDPFEREYLLASQSKTYYLTDHYATFECVLIRMPQADPVELRRLFEQAWLAYAPRKLVQAYRAEKGLP